jgi:hypothetical protein
MAKDIYVEENRRMKKVGAQDNITNIQLLRPVINQETGAMELENDLSRANFDVTADVGPSSSSKKAATVRALTGMMQITQDPETLQVLGSMAMMNMEGEGIDEVQQFFRNRLIKMGVVKANEKEQEQLMAEAQNQQPDPNAVFLQAAAEEATAKASQARANVVKTIADAELSKAKTVETMAGIDISEQNAALNLIEKMMPQQNAQP